MSLLWFLILGFGPEKVENGIKFSYFDPKAREVYLVGEFNNWDTRSTPMTKEPNGYFWVVVPLLRGRYEYKFFVDGEWRADPSNPVTVPPYGNSVIEIDENGNIIPPRIFSNTPLSSWVYFGINLKVFTNIVKDSLFNRIRVKDHTEDIKLDLKSKLSLVDLWVRLRYNTRENLDTLSKLIPIRIERAIISFGNLPHIKVFFNEWVFESQEGFYLVGKQGEFREPFGRNEQGILMGHQKDPVKRLDLLYANELTSDRDLLYGNFLIGLKNLDLGLSLRLIEGFNRQFNVPSPDTLMSNDSIPIKFNLFERDIFLTLYSHLLRSNLKLSFGTGKRWVVSGETDLDGRNISWVRDNKKWEKFNSNRIKGVIGPESFNLFIDYEFLKYSYLFFGGTHGWLKQVSTGVKVSKKLANFFIEGNIYQITQTASKPEFPWENLFDLSYNTRLSYHEFPIMDKKMRMNTEWTLKQGMHFNQLFIEPFYKFSMSNGLKIPKHSEEPRWWSNYILGFLKPSSWSLPSFSVERFGFTILYRGFGFYVENRLASLKAKEFLKSFSYCSPYVEAFYYINPNAKLKLSFGLSPWNLNDEERNHREFLIERGVTSILLRKNFLRIGRIMDEAEKSLRDYRVFSIWAELNF